MQKLKIILVTFLASLAFVPALAAPAVVYAQTDSKAAICQGVALTGADCTGNSGPSVEKTIKLVVNILSWVVGVIAVIFIIIGGLKYVTSSGDSGNVNSAKNTILYAIVGLIVVALAQIIVRFVVNKVT